jgi:hypothetical protein
VQVLERQRDLRRVEARAALREAPRGALRQVEEELAALVQVHDQVQLLAALEGVAQPRQERVVDVRQNVPLRPRALLPVVELGLLAQDLHRVQGAHVAGRPPAVFTAAALGPPAAAAAAAAAPATAALPLHEDHAAARARAEKAQRLEVRRADLQLAAHHDGGRGLLLLPTVGQGTALLLLVAAQLQVVAHLHPPEVHGDGAQAQAQRRRVESRQERTLQLLDDGLVKRVPNRRRAAAAAAADAATCPGARRRAWPVHRALQPLPIHFLAIGAARGAAACAAAGRRTPPRAPRLLPIAAPLLVAAAAAVRSAAAAATAQGPRRERRRVHDKHRAAAHSLHGGTFAQGRRPLGGGGRGGRELAQRRRVRDPGSRRYHDAPAAASSAPPCLVVAAAAAAAAAVRSGSCARAHASHLDAAERVVGAAPARALQVRGLHHAAHASHSAHQPPI